MACSALKHSYRDHIMGACDLSLHGTRATILARLTDSLGHFIPADLLESKIAILDPPSGEAAYFVQDINQTSPWVVAGFLADFAIVQR